MNSRSLASYEAVRRAVLEIGCHRKYQDIGNEACRSKGTVSNMMAILRVTEPGLLDHSPVPNPHHGVYDLSHDDRESLRALKSSSHKSADWPEIWPDNEIRVETGSLVDPSLDPETPTLSSGSMICPACWDPMTQTLMSSGPDIGQLRWVCRACEEVKAVAPRTPTIPSLSSVSATTARSVVAQYEKERTQVSGVQAAIQAQNAATITDPPKRAVEVPKDRDQALDLLRSILSPDAPKIDMDSVIETIRQEVAREVEAQGKGTIQVTIGDRETKVFKSQDKHYMFPKALRILGATKILALIGPAGSGKTTISSQLAEALDLPFFGYSCTMGMSESQITGRLGFDNVFLTTPFIEAVENGGVIMLDEFDAMSDNVRLVINNVVANGHMAVPNRVDNPMAVKHPDFHLIVGMNTFGLGATSEYTGRDTVDLATRDRFQMCKLVIDYDRDLEHQFKELGKWRALETSETWRCSKLSMTPGRVLEKIRANLYHEKVSGLVLSTRSKVDAVKLLKADFPIEEILEIYFLGLESHTRDRLMTGVE